MSLLMTPRAKRSLTASPLVRLAGAAVLLATSAVVGGCPTVGDSPDDFNGVGEYPNVRTVMPTPLEHEQQRMPAYTSGRALAVTEASVFVVDQGNGVLVEMDRESMTVVRTIGVGVKPEQVVVDAAGNAYVTIRDDGAVVRVPAGGNAVDGRVDVGVEPWGIARHPSKPILYVTLGMSNELVVIDADAMTEIPGTRIVFADVDEPSPRSVAVSDAGLLVTHQYGDLSHVALDDAGMPINTGRRSLRQGSPADEAIIPARTPRITSTHALAATVHPAGVRTFVVHNQVTPGDENDLRLMAAGLSVDPSAPPPIAQYYGPEMQADRFGLPLRPVEMGITTLQGGARQAPVARPPVADPLTYEPMTHLISDPSDINHHPTWSLLFVTGFGSDNVLAFNSAATDPMGFPVAEFKVGQAPKAIAFAPDGSKAYVLNAHSYTVSVLVLDPLFDMQRKAPKAALGMSDLTGTGFGFNEEPVEFLDPAATWGAHTDPLNLKARSSHAFGVDPLPEELRQGRRVFTFARNDRLSRMGHFSCNTCHFEGREDKLTWVVTQGPRQTPALAGRLHDTAPFNWNGTKDHLQSNMTRTVTRMGGSGLTATEKDNLEQFLLRGFDEPFNPNVMVADFEVQAAQERGAVLFFGKGKCASCHVGGDSVDGLNHDVGTVSEPELDAFEALAARGDAEVTNARAFNTPSLRGLHYTAPYLHDGSAKTIRQALELTRDTMGDGLRDLTDEEMDDLVAFLETL